MDDKLNETPDQQNLRAASQKVSTALNKAEQENETISARLLSLQEKLEKIDALQQKQSEESERKLRRIYLITACIFTLHVILLLFLLFS